MIACQKVLAHQSPSKHPSIKREGLKSFLVEFEFLMPKGINLKINMSINDAVSAYHIT